MKSLIILITVIFFCSCSKYSNNSNKDNLICIQIIDRNGINDTVSTKERLSKYENIDFKNSQPYKQVVRIYGNKSNDNKVSKITTYHPNGLIEQYIEVLNGRAFGKYQKWHENGKIAIIANVIGGPAGVSPFDQAKWIFDGICTGYDENGNISSVFNYKKGNLEDSALYYYPNGSIKKSISYKNNQIHGEIKKYFINGEIKEKITYLNDQKHGKAEKFYLNNDEKNILVARENYKKDLLIQGQYYDNNGNEVSSISKGFGIKTIYKKDNNKITVEYENGKIHGKIKRYSKDILLHEYSLSDNEKNGEEIIYYPQSTIPKITIPWISSKIHGLVKTWYNNSTMQSQKEMYDNKKNGTLTTWYKNGDIMIIENYENDKLVKGSYYQIGENIPISTIINGNGIATIFDENGTFLKKINYYKGLPQNDGEK